MKQFLLVAATSEEIKPTLDFLRIKGGEPGIYEAAPGSARFIVCITGVGMVKTAFALGRLAGKNFDVAINAGVAGSFGKFQPGDVVRVESDRFSDLGAEDGDNFLTIDALGLGSQEVRLKDLWKHTLLSKIPLAEAITVNTVHGKEESIAKLHLRLQPEIESMEGAAFIYAANELKWPALQLRAISNVVERRNRNAWRLDLAIGNLNKVLVELVQAVSAA